MLKRGKKLYIFILIALSPIFIVLISNCTVEYCSRNLTFSDVTKIDKNKVGLVLGTSKMLSNGRINLYFKYRIEATVKLYKHGKIDYVLVSGDNGNKGYDEPTDFKLELISQGIPEHKIYLDYAGFRTLDSVIRSKEIFGQQSITFISQEFHNERAIYFARKKGMKAVGFNATDVSGRYGLKVQIREYLARTKALLDILFNVKPKFLGDKIVIG